MIWLNNKDISIVVKDKKFLAGMYAMQKSHNNTKMEYYNSTVNLDDAAAVFKFGADYTKVEWNHVVALHSHPQNDRASDNDMSLLKINLGAIYYVSEQKLLFYNSKKARIENEIFIINTSSELLKRLNEKFMK